MYDTRCLLTLQHGKQDQSWIVDFLGPRICSQKRQGKNDESVHRKQARHSSYSKSFQFWRSEIV